MSDQQHVQVGSSSMRRSARRSRERGSAFIVVVLVIGSLAVVASIATMLAVTRARTTSETSQSNRAYWAAEMGAAMKVHELRDSMGTGTAPASFVLGDNRTATVTCTPLAGGYLRINSVGTANAGPNQTRHEVELVLQPMFHPLFYKAAYVGNSMGIAGYRLRFGPDQGLSVGGATWSESVYQNQNTVMNEVTYGIDFNNDGDFYDAPTLGQIHTNAAAWGWSGFTQASSSNRRIDINKSGVYEVPAVTTPTQVVNPQLRNPALDSPTPVLDPTFDTTTHSNDADYIEGDVYVNGDTDIRGMTNIHGVVDATGVSDGDPVGSISNDGATPIPAPDLSAMNYDSMADRIVTGASIPSYMLGESSTTDYYGTDLSGAGTHDNTHFRLKTVLDFASEKDTKLILVKGNLWVHDTSSFTANLDPAAGNQKVTIVVEGNLYIADDVNYHPTNPSNPNNSGVLFIVKGKDSSGGSAESYVDANRNYKFDAGETILHDNGNGTYEGPKEGQGNIFFGDPRFGTGGVTDGYMYAENNVYMVNPPMSASPPTGADAVFGVFGFLSAGGVMDLNDRTAGTNYNNFRIKYDPRLADGSLTFKGMPPGLGGGWNQAPVRAWRQVR